MSASLLIATLILAASPGQRRTLDQDDCSRRSAACERACESRHGNDRLSCKTDCRLQETECRNGRRPAGG
jgi:hypothetical protein